MATIGLIAGGGRFPLLFAESARRAGHRVIAVAHGSETDPALAERVDAITWVKLGQIGHMLEALKAGGAHADASCSARSPSAASSPTRCSTRPACGCSRGSRSAPTTTCSGRSPRFLEEEGMPITDPTPFLADRLAPEGVMGRHAPTDEELADARYGLELARGIGRLDLGQTVVVKDRVALAVEALEGTDACIRRGGELARGRVRRREGGEAEPGPPLRPARGRPGHARRRCARRAAACSRSRRARRW